MPAFTSSLRPSMRLATTAAQSARSFSSSSSRSLARMIITGRLAADPELQATSSGQDIVRYALGSSHGPRDNRQVSWFQITSFVPEGPQRDYILNLPKGTLVYLEGDATMRPYDDADGKKQYRMNIVQRTLEVLRRPASSAPGEHSEASQ